MALEPPSQAEGGGLFTVTSYNIQSGRNGGLESALRVMKQMGVDCGVILETKLTKGVYTRWSSGYNVRSTHAPSKWQGGISLFWRTSGTYEIEEVEIRGPNVLSFQLVSGAARWHIIGCYIPPNDLTTLTHVDEAWRACPKGCLPILLGDLNVNLAAPRNLGWQCRQMCLSVTPLKRQTFLSVVDMSEMSSRHVDDILLCRPFFWLSPSCRRDLLPTHFPTCT